MWGSVFNNYDNGFIIDKMYVNVSKRYVKTSKDKTKGQFVGNVFSQPIPKNMLQLLVSV